LFGPFFVSVLALARLSGPSDFTYPAVALTVSGALYGIYWMDALDQSPLGRVVMRLPCWFVSVGYVVSLLGGYFALIMLPILILDPHPGGVQQPHRTTVANGVIVSVGPASRQPGVITVDDLRRAWANK
jgi:hypothetical protein